MLLKSITKCIKWSKYGQLRRVKTNKQWFRLFCAKIVKKLTLTIKVFIYLYLFTMASVESWDKILYIKSLSHSSDNKNRLKDLILVIIKTDKGWKFCGRLSQLENKPNENKSRPTIKMN